MAAKISLMKSIIYSLLLIFTFSLPGSLASQNTAGILDRAYGPDQTLCNGKKYNCFLPPGTLGHQYLDSPDFQQGGVTLREKSYSGVLLNYDIFNQQLLLKFDDESGALNIIEISQAWLKSFRLGSKTFELLSTDQNPGIYQVLGEGPVKICYFWRKNLNLVSAIGSSNYTFTKASKDSYVYMGGQLRPFSTKRSFIRLFAPEHRQEIKSWLRKNRIRINKSSDQVIAEMITFVGKIR